MVELRVGSDALDIYKSEVISFLIAINDIASIESASGSYSNKFEIPSTSNNNAILGYPSEINFVGGFKPTKSRDASVLVDGLEVQRGFIQIEQYNATKKSFSISFSSGNSEWFDLISDKNLIDIKLDSYNHTWNSINVVNSFTNTDGYIYPFINYGRYNSISTNNMPLINWMPAMYSHTLVRRLFDDIGWKVSGSLFNDPIFKKHVIPFSRKEVKLNKDIVNGLGLSSRLNLPYTYVSSVPIVFDNIIDDSNQYGNYDDSTGVYTSNIVFSAKIRAYVSKSPLGTFSLRVNGVAVDTKQTGTVFIEYETTLQIGDTVDVVTNSGGTNISPYTAFYVIAKDLIVEDMEMPISSTLPDMSQEDFISTIFNQFGAVFISDNISKTVYINKFEDIKSNTVNALDWSDKIDLSRDIETDYTEIVSDYGKVNTYKYNENKDSSNYSFGSDVNPFLGDGSFKIDNDFLSKDNDLFKSSFVSTQNVRCLNGRVDLFLAARYSDGSIDEDSPNVDPLPRCAICVNGVEVSDLFDDGTTSINVVGVGSTTNSTTVPYVYFDTVPVSSELVNSINQSLSFGSNLTPKAHRNLLETNYEDYINILNNPRKLTAYFLLNERDINNLNLLIPIYLGGKLNSYFYINKISDYRPMDGGVTKVELVLIS